MTEFYSFAQAAWPSTLLAKLELQLDSAITTMSGTLDPDALALLFVQQYLSENGYSTALTALEQASGIKYDDDKPRRGSELLELVYTHVEQQLAAGDTEELFDPSDPHATSTASSHRHSRQLQLQQQHAKLQEELMLRSAVADYPSFVGHTVGPLAANLLAVLLWPSEDLLAVGAADGSVRLLRYIPQAAQQGPAEGSTAAAAAAAASKVGDSTGGGSSGSSTEVWATRLAGAGGVLTLAWHPDIQAGRCRFAQACNSPNSLLLAGCMDGSVHLLNAFTGHLLVPPAKPHSKYVVAIAWAPVLLSPAEQQQQQQGEQLIATASYDSSCCLLRLVWSSDKQQHQQALSLELIQQVPFSGYVQDVCFLPPGSAPPPPSPQGFSAAHNSASSSSTGTHAAGSNFPNPSSSTASAGQQEAAGEQHTQQQSSLDLVVAFRGTNCLNILTVQLLRYTSTSGSSSNTVDAAAAAVAGPTSSSGGSRGSSAVWKVTAAGLVNMSEAGDSHVSFSPMRLAVSPCERYLLIASDSPILLVLRLSDWGVVRRLYGLDTDKFHNASVAWHRSSSYILAGAAHAAVYVYHLGTAKIVAKLRGHTVNVRAIHYDTASNRLATCSFDKSVKVYEQP